MALDIATFNLPIVDGEVLFRKDQYEAAPEEGRAEFTRAIHVSVPPRITDLNAALELAKKHFSLLRNSGLDVVQHAWCLVPLDVAPVRSYKSYLTECSMRLLPKGFILGATVSVVKPTPIPEEDRFRLSRSYSSYNSTVTRDDCFAVRLSDLTTDQAVYGISPGNMNEPTLPSWCFVDIEPIF